ncbi:hypothetical protein X942_5634 [Burkholderia pseudomallei MSHR5596]|nr:hypothetical protein X948_5210 [Burkholderia pseudomallei MSHR5608]KGS73797.1 hypothetical protein X942_5634 [Burkholderia pseudomallei MSHR5596]
MSRFSLGQYTLTSWHRLLGPLTAHAWRSAWRIVRGARQVGCRLRRFFTRLLIKRRLPVHRFLMRRMRKFLIIT